MVGAGGDTRSGPAAERHAMTYELHYWDLPFRGIFVELVLAEAGADWTRHSPGAIYPDHRLERAAPGMAPPFLVDTATGRTLSQMPAIVFHLAGRHGLLPQDEWPRALSLKLVLDANDVLEGITRCGGMAMWTAGDWQDFRTGRLAEWMRIFEGVARGTALEEGADWMFGDLSLADLTVCALWGMMIHAFPLLRADLETHAPTIAALNDRVAVRPRIAEFLETQRARHGRGYCGGQIEASLRDVIGT